MVVFMFIFRCFIRYLHFIIALLFSKDNQWLNSAIIKILKENHKMNKEEMKERIDKIREL